MVEVPVTLKFVTPAFIAGQDNRNSSEFRVPSLKGLLRFWWRAFHAYLTTQELFKAESDIFGDTEQRAKVSIIVGSPSCPRCGHLSNLSASIGYLGYGPISYDSRAKAFRTTRPCILAGEDLQIRLQFRSESQEVKRSVYNSLWLLTHLGGLGARSRRGFGSVQCFALGSPDDDLPFIVEANNPREFKTHLEGGLQKILAGVKTWGAKALPAFSSLSSQTEVYILNEVFKDWQEALEGIGMKFLGYRSNRRHQPSKSLPGKDYDLVCGPSGFMTCQSISQAPKRAAFGLPHNYFSSSQKRAGRVPFKAEFRWQFDDKEFDRRASPLLFHVTRLGNGRHCVVITWLRSQFLPQGAKIKAILPEDKTSGFLGKEIFVDPPPDNAIGDFLDRLKKAEELVAVSFPM
ncbi:hypothetical protein HKBW3C_00893 [Candidatus Hakubella thermalkaliphila]|nr:hypothetical protein HKBW3C_00893 [Candidatus Hakubella thermalkaliphila]